MMADVYDLVCAGGFNLIVLMMFPNIWDGLAIAFSYNHQPVVACGGLLMRNENG